MRCPTSIQDSGVAVVIVVWLAKNHIKNVMASFAETEATEATTTTVAVGEDSSQIRLQTQQSPQSTSVLFHENLSCEISQKY